MLVSTSMGVFGVDDRDHAGAGRSPLVLVHGFPIDRSMWRDMTPLIEPARRVIAPDLIGHGESHVRSQVSISDIADGVFAVLDSLGVGMPVMLGGLSMGGIVCLDAWRRYAQRIAGLLLIDTRPNAESPEGRANRFAAAERVERDGAVIVADAMRGKLFADSTPMSLQEPWFARLAATPRLGAAAASRALADRVDSWKTLSTISVPTLVVVGDHDVITPPELASQMHERIVGSSLAIIKDAGHIPPVEQPAATADAVNAFLATIG